jgi:hypothetical protein
VAIRKEDTKLLDAVNKILMDGKADGTLAAEQTRWLGAPTGALPDNWAQQVDECRLYRSSK